jgi:hypothetical protein
MDLQRLPQLKHAKASRELAVSVAAEQAAAAAQAALVEEMRELSGTCRWAAWGCGSRTAISLHGRV